MMVQYIVLHALIFNRRLELSKLKIVAEEIKAVSSFR